jgi:hypothetical protein
MKRLLEHLIAHQNTKDPWILVYDSLGSLPSGVGDCITLNSFDSDQGLLFGFPVIREITAGDVESCNPVFSVRVSRQYLQPMIERLQNMVA